MICGTIGTSELDSLTGNKKFSIFSRKGSVRNSIRQAFIQQRPNLLLTLQSIPGGIKSELKILERIKGRISLKENGKKNIYFPRKVILFSHGTVI